jgi:hypothetical protein
LRKALDKFKQAGEAYEKALETLPKESLSKADIGIKKQCEDEMNAVKAKTAKGPPVIWCDPGEMLS